ncbi:hypothetical protein N866_20140 [Actinotalea ferrariae CF5-4]|uniref:ATPase AAA-type core domain-containing protein n=1 Tax=Actinotalea ferrariae CF5-4 TaxID=948458 RepID=A0A021VQN9_9CELL|nr:AAA family ATPase [Actinotalea ferrariae]EYR63519.1 hypothetical protein N866_20140 [Actinotalea ferrariae CF5-4]
MEPDARRPAAIRGVYIRKYKNLRDIWLPWHDGTAIFGANGTGKTNLLEALAILFNAEEALPLTAKRRADITPGDLEVIAQVPIEELPWPPNTQFTVPEKIELHELPGLVRAILDRRWWDSIGGPGGDTFAEGIAALGVPEAVVTYLRDQIDQPVIRYTLRDITFKKTSIFDDDLPGTVDDDPPSSTVRYDRTLLGAAPPASVAEIAAVLPDVFAPLRTALAEHTRGATAGMVDLLALPPAESIPVTLQWLPRARDNDEIDQALKDAYLDAYPRADQLTRRITRLGITQIPSGDPPDLALGTDRWLHLVMADAANKELALTMPDQIAVEPVGSFEDADFYLTNLRTKTKIGRTGRVDMLEKLSSGERRWADEALATAGRAVIAFGLRATIYDALLASIDEALILPPLVSVMTEVQALVDQVGYFSIEAIQRVVDVLDPVLREAAQQQLRNAPDPLRRSLVENLYGLHALTPVTTVRVLDEPEAHLHPRAQRVVAGALENLRRSGDQILIATHSPQFLDLPGWALAHLQSTPEGSTLSPLAPQDLDARGALAGEMGFTRGELLARITCLLIVEGEHDRLVLDTLYGDQLNDAGIGIIRMFGTRNLLATAELDFIDRILDVPIALLIDNTRKDIVNGNRPNRELTGEERQLRDLKRECDNRGRPIHVIGLNRPDITAYLHPDAVRTLHPSFPGWDKVIQQYRAQRHPHSFKDWLHDQLGVDLRWTTRITAALDQMSSQSLSVEPELARKVEDLLRRVITSGW